MPKKKKGDPPTPLPLGLEAIALDIKMAATFLSTSVRQIRTLILRGELSPFTLGKKQLLRVADLRTFVEKKAAV